MILPIAALPEVGYLIIVCVVVAVIALVGFLAIMRFLQSLRTKLATELMMQMGQMQQPSQVNIQTPLEIKQHPGVATRIDLDTVRDELHGRLKRERNEINLEIRRVEQVTEKRAADLAAATEKRADVLAADIKENTALTQSMSGEVKQINQNVHLILTSLSQPK